MSRADFAHEFLRRAGTAGSASGVTAGLPQSCSAQRLYGDCYGMAGRELAVDYGDGLLLAVASIGVAAGFAQHEGLRRGGAALRRRSYFAFLAAAAARSRR